MANLSEDIQCASFDTRPPMLDKTDFASWQQRIRFYCRGKENGVNILKSINEGPFQMGTTRVIVAERTEGSLHLGPERPRVYSDLSQDEKDRTKAITIQTTLLCQVCQAHMTGGSSEQRTGNNAWGAGAAGYGGAQNRENALDPKSPTYSDTSKTMMLANASSRDGLIDCDVYDSDVDEATTANKLCFMGKIYHPQIQADAICEHHEEHGMQDDVQPSYVVDSHADHTSDSNMTPYDQYVKDNAEPVVQHNASTVPNDMYVMIDNDLHKPKAQSV
ncbi:hypothetical protein Tco_1114447 [Tanacetum coccineum]|uniref:Integrase, catalytic region, zinc finger, CCHC-type, peptidase aspartic, catalytic n=1 Tax=Tanacetum coccineum TaxID=301880 RepID=A0ABQ5IYS8_9ASTR